MATISDVLATHGLRDEEPWIAELLDEYLRERWSRTSVGLPAADRELLEAGGLAFGDAQARPPQPASTAAFLRLLADSLTASEVAERLGVDVSRVRHRIADGQLYALRKGRGVRVPAFQFGTDGTPLPGLTLVLATIPRDAHPLAVAGFFETTQPELVRDDDVPLTPSQWLEAGGDARLAADLAAGAFSDA